MEEVITEAEAPSRLLEEDLNIFTPKSPPLPSPFFIFPHNNKTFPQPSLLIIALSPSSLSLFHQTLQTLTLTASLVLPELPNPDHALSLFSLSPSIHLLAASAAVPAARSCAVARAILALRPASVLILDSLHSRHFRGRLAPDSPLALKLETSPERAHPQKLLPDLDYYPSGSVVDGLAAALLSRSQILRLRATLCLSWPHSDASVVTLLKGLLQSGVLKGFDFGSTDAHVFKFPKAKDTVLHSQLYI